MTNKDRDRIVNYAIDNKVSLEEAEEIYRLYKDEAEKEKELEGEYLSQEAIDNGHFAADGQLTPEELEMYSETVNKEILENMQKIYKEHTDEVTKEEMEWVEWELGTVEKLIREGKI
jgi:uncharacterized protein YerC